jgi:hypothetical protein
MPRLRILGRDPRAEGDPGTAQLSFVHERPGDRFGGVRAIHIEWRAGLPACSQCSGQGCLFDGKTDTLHTCDWCGGVGSSVMDLAMRIAQAWWETWLDEEEGKEEDR